MNPLFPDLESTLAVLETLFDEQRNVAKLEEPAKQALSSSASSGRYDSNATPRRIRAAREQVADADARRAAIEAGIIEATSQLRCQYAAVSREWCALLLSVKEDGGRRAHSALAAHYGSARVVDQILEANPTPHSMSIDHAIAVCSAILPSDFEPWQITNVVRVFLNHVKNLNESIRAFRKEPVEGE